ncbi:MAG: hypothetical protein DMG65_12005 [Candidatus Angelobacter sp. Gp1-AA117]|nr:MAG: hypothetical protein DMG65_12005 [Candidatus Angelobacter sp. Gp1-AA117]
MTGEFQGIQYRQSADDPSMFFLVPGSPSPELLPSGAPAANIIGTDAMGILQLGVHWNITSEQMQTVEQHLRNKFPEIDPPLQLRIEPVAVEAVRLLLTMPDGSSTELATASSSNYLPFTALFNLTLQGDRYGQARLAITGQRQVLKVRYEASTELRATCTATISGDVRNDLEQLDPSSDVDACRAQIESALSDGRIQLAVSGDEVSEDLRTRTVDAAKRQAANVLQRMLAGTDAALDAAQLDASARLDEPRTIKLAREADVGEWFTGSRMANFTVSPVKLTAAQASTARTFKIGFDLKDFSVAMVQVCCGNAQAAFRPPAFDPVSLKVETGKPVTVKTSYTDGGPVYESKVNADADPVVLQPEHLGFCKVLFDGSACKQSGAQRVKLQAKYRPSHNGTEDDHNINWNYGDWNDIWFVTSRESALDGVIKYRWQETSSDGTETEHPFVETANPEIKI